MRPHIASPLVVTGCNGFIGTHVVEALLKRSWGELLTPGAKPRTASLRFSNFDAPCGAGEDAPLEVVGVDLPESASRSNAARFAGSSRYRFLTHAALLSALEDGSLRPAAIIHNGACSSTVETDPRVFAELNVDSSQRLWKACARLGIPFLYASSAAVYGDGARGFSDAVEDCGCYEALNLYGKSKLDFDLWALARADAPPFWFGLRYFNVYGPFEAHKGGQASMVFHGYNQITRTGALRLFESNHPDYPHGGQKRDFIFVDDIVRYTLELLSRSLRALHRGEAAFPAARGAGFERGGLFVNLGTGTARAWNELGSHLFASLSLPTRIEYIPMPAPLARQYQNFTCAAHGGLTRLGLEPAFTDLGTGVRTYVQRYLLRGL